MEKLLKLIGYMLVGTIVGLISISVCEMISVESAKEYRDAILVVGPILTGGVYLYELGFTDIRGQQCFETLSGTRHTTQTTKPSLAILQCGQSGSLNSRMCRQI